VDRQSSRFFARANWLDRELGNEIESPLHPPGECIISRKACRIDADEAGQIPVGELHRKYVRLRSSRTYFRGPLAYASRPAERASGRVRAIANGSSCSQRPASRTPSHNPIVAS
jgi:hypothetical protein